MHPRTAKCAAGLLLALLLNTAYIASFSSPTIGYMANVLMHLLLGIALTLGTIWLIVKGVVGRKISIALFLFLSGAAMGFWLAIRGNLTENRWLLLLHIIFAAAALVAFIPYALKQPQFNRAYSFALVLLFVMPVAGRAYRALNPAPGQRIKNPSLVPVTLKSISPK